MPQFSTDLVSYISNDFFNHVSEKSEFEVQCKPKYPITMEEFVLGLQQLFETIEKRYHFTIDIFNKTNTSLRSEYDVVSKKTSNIQKNTRKKIDLISNYNIILTLKDETPLPTIYKLDFENIGTVRIKDRVKFLLQKNWVLDITKVYTGNNIETIYKNNYEKINNPQTSVKDIKNMLISEPFTYEVELELVDYSLLKNGDSWKLVVPLEKWLCELYNCEIIKTNQQYQNAINIFRNKLNITSNFTSFYTKPINFHGYQLLNFQLLNFQSSTETPQLNKTVVSNNFVASAKADGIQYFILITEDGIYTIQTFYKYPDIKFLAERLYDASIINTIIQVEYIPPQSRIEEYIRYKYLYLIIDVLIFNNIDIRTKSKMERHSNIPFILKSLNVSSVYIFFDKPIYILDDKQNFIKGMYSILKTPFICKTDGIIFSENSVYKSSIYKWKPLHQLTIDLKFVNGKGLIFDDENKLVELANITQQQNPHNIYLTQNSIIECLITCSNKIEFTVIRTRPDKQHPNNMKIFNDLIIDLKNPIDENILLNNNKEWFVSNFFNSIKTYYDAHYKYVHNNLSPISITDLLKVQFNSPFIVANIIYNENSEINNYKQLETKHDELAKYKQIEIQENFYIPDLRVLLPDDYMQPLIVKLYKLEIENKPINLEPPEPTYIINDCVGGDYIQFLNSLLPFNSNIPASDENKNTSIIELLYNKDDNINNNNLYTNVKQLDYLNILDCIIEYKSRELKMLLLESDVQFIKTYFNGILKMYTPNISNNLSILNIIPIVSQFFNINVGVFNNKKCMHKYYNSERNTMFICSNI